MAVLFKHFLDSFFVDEANPIWQRQLLNDWDKIVGNLKTRICLEKIHKTVLIIGVYEPHWMQELYLLSNVLINKINTYLGCKRIEKLRFKLINKKEKITKYQKYIDKKMTDKLKTPKILLNPAQERALFKIKDDQLKKVLTDFLACCLVSNGS